MTDNDKRRVIIDVPWVYAFLMFAMGAVTGATIILAFTDPRSASFAVLIAGLQTLMAIVVFFIRSKP